MFGIFESITELACDLVKIVAAPVEIAVDAADALLKPVAEAAQDVVEAVKSLKD